VQRVPAEQQAAGPGAYYMGPAVDGSRPGIFFVNLRDLRANPVWGMKTLAYHEGVPGHHFQGLMALKQDDLPWFRRLAWYPAYGEGWALYAERLAAEMGLYAEDPLAGLGRLQAELMRAVRLVVDTGLHAEGWSRERAIDYMTSTTGLEREGVTSEVERYMESPGQACAYKVGHTVIARLREQFALASGEEMPAGKNAANWALELLAAEEEKAAAAAAAEAAEVAEVEAAAAVPSRCRPERRAAAAAAAAAVAAVARACRPAAAAAAAE
jgi:uncharacterized protein (DUF885 family)